MVFIPSLVNIIIMYVVTTTIQHLRAYNSASQIFMGKPVSLFLEHFNFFFFLIKHRARGREIEHFNSVMFYNTYACIQLHRMMLKQIVQLFELPSHPRSESGSHLRGREQFLCMIKKVSIIILFLITFFLFT